MTVGEISEEIQSKIGYDAGLDYITLNTWLSTIGRIASLVIGVLAVLLLILLPIVISLEVCYICFPTIQDKLNEVKSDHETHGIRNRLAQLVLRDAVRAVEESTINSAVNAGSTNDALWRYCKIKIKAVLFAVVVLIFVLQGWTSLIHTVWKFVAPLVEMASNFFTSKPS